MAVSCSILRNKETGKIEKVLAPNGQESILWENIKNMGLYATNPEEGLRVWASVYTKSFKEEFGNWELLQEAKELAPQVTQDIYRNALASNPEQVLFEIATQYGARAFEEGISDPREGAYQIFPQRVVEIADILYPNVAIGDTYVPRMGDKIDANGEPLITHVLDIPEYEIAYDQSLDFETEDLVRVRTTEKFNELQEPAILPEDFVEDSRLDGIFLQNYTKKPEKIQATSFEGLINNLFNFSREENKKKYTPIIIDSDRFKLFPLENILELYIYDIQEVGVKKKKKDFYRSDLISMKYPPGSKFSHMIFIKASDNEAFRQFYPFIDFSKKFTLKGSRVSYYVLTNRFEYDSGKNIRSKFQKEIDRKIAASKGRYGLTPIKTRPRLSSRLSAFADARVEELERHAKEAEKLQALLIKEEEIQQKSFDQIIETLKLKSTVEEEEIDFEDTEFRRSLIKRLSNKLLEKLIESYQDYNEKLGELIDKEDYPEIEIFELNNDIFKVGIDNIVKKAEEIFNKFPTKILSNFLRLGYTKFSHPRYEGLTDNRTMTLPIGTNAGLARKEETAEIYSQALLKKYTNLETLSDLYLGNKVMEYKDNAIFITDAYDKVNKEIYSGNFRKTFTERESTLLDILGIKPFKNIRTKKYAIVIAMYDLGFDNISIKNFLKKYKERRKGNNLDLIERYYKNNPGQFERFVGYVETIQHVESVMELLSNNSYLSIDTSNYVSAASILTNFEFDNRLDQLITLPYWAVTLNEKGGNALFHPYNLGRGLSSYIYEVARGSKELAIFNAIVEKFSREYNIMAGVFDNTAEPKEKFNQIFGALILGTDPELRSYLKRQPSSILESLILSIINIIQYIAGKPSLADVFEKNLNEIIEFAKLKNTYFVTRETPNPHATPVIRAHEMSSFIVKNGEVLNASSTFSSISRDIYDWPEGIGFIEHQNRSRELVLERLRFYIDNNVSVDTINNFLDYNYAHFVFEPERNFAGITSLPEGINLSRFGRLYFPDLTHFPTDFEMSHSVDTFIAPKLEGYSIPSKLENLLDNIRHTVIGTVEVIRTNQGRARIVPIDTMEISASVSKLLTNAKPKYNFSHAATLYSADSKNLLPFYRFDLENKPYNIKLKDNPYHGKAYNIEFSASSDSPFPEEVFELMRLKHANRIMSTDRPLGWFGGILSNDGKTFSLTELQSDILQRTKDLELALKIRLGYSERDSKKIKTQIENYYDGWIYVFTATAIRLLKKNFPNLEQLNIPVSSFFAQKITRKTSDIVRVYDKISQSLSAKETNNPNWKTVDVRNILSSPENSKKNQYDFIIKSGINAGLKEQKQIAPDVGSDREIAFDMLQSLSETPLLNEYMRLNSDHIREIEKWIEETFSDEKPVTDSTEGGELVGPDGEVIGGEEESSDSELDELIKETARKKVPFDIDYALDQLSEAMKRGDQVQVSFLKKLLEENTKPGSRIGFNRTSGNYKEVLSEENRKIFEDLIAKGLITERRWKGMYFVPKQYYESTFNPAFRTTNKDYRDGFFTKDKAKYNQLKAYIDMKQLGWLDVREAKSGDSYIVTIMPNRQEGIRQRLSKEVGEGAFRAIADRLSQRLGIPYEIIDTAEAERITKESNIPWNGEGAFSYKGKVYVLREALSLENGIHEFAHFFIEAVSKESPYLVQKLYKMLEENPVTRARYIDMVDEVYSDFSKEDRVKEVLVRALTDKAINMVDPETGNVLVEVVKKIFRTIANLIKTLFGISVKNLNENTTLDQLAAILVGEREGETIDLGDRNTGVFNDLFPMFNREMANELEKLSTSAVQTSIDSFFTAIDQHWKRILEDQDLTKLKEVMSNDKDGTIIGDDRQMLKLAKKFSQTVDENIRMDRDALTTFAEAVEGQVLISQKMAEHVASFDEGDAEVSTQDKLAIFRKYSFIAREWSYVFGKFNEAIQSSQIGLKKNPLSDAVQNAMNNYSFINSRIAEFYERDGLVKVFKEEIESNPYYQASIQEIKDRIAELEKAYETNKSNAIQKKLNKEKELLRRYELTDETIIKYLIGEMGDTNHYSMYLESYTSSPDPIVGLFSNWFIKQKFKAQVVAQQRLTEFENKISKIYKKLGIKNSDFLKVAKYILQKEKFYDGYENYEGVSREAWTFINQYKNDKDGLGWDFVYNFLMEDRENAKMRMFSNIRGKGYENVSGEEEFREKSRILEQFKLDYMFSEESPKVTEARLFWFRDNITHEAKRRRDEVLDQIKKNNVRDITKDESLEKFEENARLWREYRRLSSFTNEDGSPKTKEEIEIAKVIREHREKYGNLYEDVEIKGMFDANVKSAEARFVDEVISEGLAQTEEEAKKTKEYKEKINGWYRENIKINLTQKFYDERQKIIDRISEITAKIKDDPTREKLDIGAKWQEILDIIKGYRDQDNQPIGSDLSDEQIKRIKELEDEIDAIRESYDVSTGLSEEELEDYDDLAYKMDGDPEKGIAPEELTDEEYAYFQRLDKRFKFKGELTRKEKTMLKRAFDDLKSLQLRIATPYYIDTVNTFLEKAGSDLKVDIFNSHKVLVPRVINKILKTNPEFKDWWNKNHRIKESWDYKAQTMKSEYVRLFPWNRIIPNDTLFKTMLENEDFEAISKYKSSLVEVTPVHQYFYRRLKPEFVNKKNKETEWVTHDNLGRWLPKPTEASATEAQKKYMADKGIPFAKDDRFENKEYLELKNSNPDIFELLNAYKEFHLESQERLARYARLGLELPRLRKNSVENADLSKLVDKPKEWWSSIKGWLGAMFMKRRDDFELGSGSYNPEAQAKTYVLTDFMGDQINSIPIKYMSHVDVDLVSMDVGKAVSMYAVSAETNKVLQEINPIANALKETLEKDTNKPKALETKRRNIIQIVSDMFNRSANVHANKRGSYNRLKIIQNFLDRELFGQTNIQQFGATGEKIAEILMKFGAWGSLGLNVFAAIKNDISGRIQNNLESITGNQFTTKELMQSNLEFGKLLTSLVNDYWNIGDKSLYTQMFLLFDPMGFYSQKAGTNFSKTATRDFLDLKFIMSLQKFGEINVQSSSWLAMMINQKVEYIDPNTKEQSIIPYMKAWEMRDGVIKLKEGVDKKWDKDGKSFLQFVMRVHKVNELNQGAYSEESQPEIHRYTLGKLFLFMRKFYIPGIVNRVAPKRFNFGLSGFREGYWIPMFSAMKSIFTGQVKSRDEFNILYSPAERRAMLRTFGEIGFIIMMGAMIKLLGYDDDDDDKYEKLEKNSFIHNFLLYQIMMIKSEAETFLPVYGMGINESVRLLGTPTIAFNTFRRWIKVGDDFFKWVLGSPDARYKQDTGIYKEGQLKYIADLLNIIGWKNFSYLTSNEDLQKGLQLYTAMQRRI